MAKKDQAELIGYLITHGWENDGHTRIEQYRLITKASYPLAGANVTAGGKPRFEKRGWRIGVGANTTIIYRRPENPETIVGVGRMAGRSLFTFRDWETYNFNTRGQEQIKTKLKELGL